MTSVFLAIQTYDAPFKDLELDMLAVMQLDEILD